MYPKLHKPVKNSVFRVPTVPTYQGGIPIFTFTWRFIVTWVVVVVVVLLNAESLYFSSEDVEFEGYTIPKGSIVWGNFWSSHHDEKLWKDPWKFKPERFLDGQGKLLPADHKLRRS